MSISVQHPERYDEFMWHKAPSNSDEGLAQGNSTLHLFGPPAKYPGRPEEWELLGISEDPVWAFQPCLWGHLKPEYRGRGTDILTEVAMLCDRLKVLAENIEGSIENACRALMRGRS